MTTEDVRSRLEGHHREAFAWALSCCRGDRDVAEDVLQTSYLKVLDGRARYDGRSTFRTFLFSVIRHTAVDSWRSVWRRLRRTFVEGDAVHMARPVSDAHESDIDLGALAAALLRLPGRQAQVLSLVYGHGMKVREAAQVLGISQGSAATHLHRGKRRLRDTLTEPRSENDGRR